jgi:hypothetical protein
MPRTLYPRRLVASVARGVLTRMDMPIVLANNAHRRATIKGSAMRFIRDISDRARNANRRKALILRSRPSNCAASPFERRAKGQRMCANTGSGTSFSRRTSPVSIKAKGRARCYWRSSAWRFNASSEITASVSSLVAVSTRGGATPASSASRQAAAQMHHRSPGFSPGNPNSSAGVIRSLPRLRANSRNSAVTSAHTTCRPRSSGPVLQQPSR